MENKKKFRTIKLFISVYAVSFLIFNWNDVSRLLNYGLISESINDFFNPYPNIIDSALAESYFNVNYSENKEEKEQTEQIEQTEQTVKQVKKEYTDKKNILEIPKLSISAPIIFSKSADNSSVAKDLKLGLAYYPGSVLPGQAGHIVILGHSAPLSWSHEGHHWEFSKLNELNTEDLVFINLNNQQYTYIVKKKTIIKKNENIPTDGFSSDDNVLTLISCWPPGKNYQRIIIQALPLTY